MKFNGQDIDSVDVLGARVLLLNTAKRGLSAVPLKRLRIFMCFLARISCLDSLLTILHSPYLLFLTGLTNLTSDYLISVLDSLALIWLWSSLLSDDCSVLANRLFVDTLNCDYLSLYNCLDSFRIFQFYRM